MISNLLRIACVVTVLLIAPFAWPMPAVAPHELRPFDAKSLEKIRYAHAGKAFVLALWSVTCAPCREEMGDWKVLQQKYPGLPIVLVATDPPSDQPAVAEFLTRYDPGRVERWAFADTFSERVRFAIDRSWRGELPRNYFYDAAHRMQARSGRIDRHWIDSWMAEQTAAAKRETVAHR